MSKRRKRPSPEQIVRKLREAESMLACGQSIGQMCQVLEISEATLQRWRNHKVRNVVGHLPQDQHEQARSTLKAAWKLDADEGI